MKQIIILGAGTAGSLIANKLYKYLSKDSWAITIIEPNTKHYYQPGFLFIPFGYYDRTKVEKPIEKLIPKGVKIIHNHVNKVIPNENIVVLDNEQQLPYDYLIVATGTNIAPEETPGLKDELWYKDIFDFYTIEGAEALQKRLQNFTEGKLVISFVDMPFKCPIAPIEFACLADEYFKKRGIRDKVDIYYVTPLSGIFTKPIASKMLSETLASKNIHIITDFYIERIDNNNKKLISFDSLEVPFDLLIIVPLNKGANFVANSNLGDELNYIPVNKYTLQMEQHKNIFVLGDAAAIPTSKAGSVVHFAGETVFENLLSLIQNKQLKSQFDGHANCYIETGFGKATIIDFNYDTEPLPGYYPIPYIGPFKLLKVNRINHWGKLAFKWLYWKFIVKGKYLPVSNHMSMAGKKIIK